MDTKRNPHPKKEEADLLPALDDEKVVAEYTQEEAQKVLEKLGIQDGNISEGAEIKLVAVEHQQQAAFHQGPLPPPGMLAEYDSALPGCAERVVSMAEKEQSHRHTWEEGDLELASKEILRGQAYGFTTLLICIIIAAFFAINGNNIAAALFLTATVIGSATSFIVGRFSNNKKELPKKG